MFDKLIQKGQKMAGEYLRHQMSQQKPTHTGGQGHYGNSQYGAPQQGGAPYGNTQHDNPPYGSASHYPGQQPGQHRGPGQPPAAPGSPQASAEDRAAIAKYRYMLQTAPPQDMERAHAEAFARLTPQQRALLQQELSEGLPPAERPRSAEPFDLARAATRAEVSRPGFMPNLLSRSSGTGRAVGAGAAGGLAAGMAGGLLAGVAGAFIGTAIAGPLLEGFSGVGESLAGAGEDLMGAGGDLLGEGTGMAEEAGGLFDGFGGFEL
ncbi:hypothetical protein [Zafaria cholistanensis]|nr:hypothetical protein [Zafaria cholistanensis]